MKTLKEHKKILRDIADLSFSYGYDNSSIDFSKIDNLDEVSKGKKEEFIHSCHEGYKLAQNKLVDEILSYQDLQISKKPKLKEARRQRDEDLEEKITKELKIIEQRLKTFSHIADGIAWQLIGGEIHIAKRFYLQEKGQKRLKESNIDHAIKVAREINKDPNNFALISDITNFIQIGDLLVVSEGTIGIMELKQGKVNKQITEFLARLKKEKKKIEDVNIKQKFDKRTAKQVKRVARQQKRMQQVSDLIKNDEGIDPVTETNLTINTPAFDMQYFHENLEKLHLELKDKIWSYDVIEGCIHVGMYKGKGLMMAPFAIKQIISQNAVNHLVVDWMSIVDNVSEPIFAKPFNPNFIIDVLTGGVRVIFGIDFDKLIELFCNVGLPTDWVSEKETMKFKQRSKHKPFEINKRAILMKANDQEIYFGGGLISKMIYDNIKPSSLAMSMLYTQK